MPIANCSSRCQVWSSGKTSSCCTQSAQRSWWTAPWSSGRNSIHFMKIIYFVKRFIYLLHPIKGLRTKQLGPSIPGTSGLSEHYLCLCSLFIHKISILIQNMMKICKACNKPFSHLISQFHTSEEIVETILHFTTNINIYKHFREISPMFVKY